MSLRVHNCSNSALANRDCLVLCVLWIALPGGISLAQKSPSCHGCPALNTPPVTLPRIPDDRVVMDTGEHEQRADTKSFCSIESFPGLVTVTTVDLLKIPSKAQKQYRAACSALKNSQLASSEQHLRKAVQIYPNYAAGWVMLGQVLEAQQQTDLARATCSHPLQTDSRYLPAYLCLAEIAGRGERWDEVLRHTSHALELDPLHDPYAYFFSAIAYFNLHQLEEAERRALKAQELDSEHHQPRVQFLLGQIYKAMNSPVKAAAQFREFLKYAPAATDAEAVKQDLAKLEAAN